MDGWALSFVLSFRGRVGLCAGVHQVGLGGVGATWGNAFGFDSRLSKLGSIAAINDDAVVLLRNHAGSDSSTRGGVGVSLRNDSISRSAQRSGGAAPSSPDDLLSGRLDEDEVVDVSGERWWVLSLGSLALLRQKIVAAGLRFFEEQPGLYEVATSKERVEEDFPEFLRFVRRLVTDRERFLSSSAVEVRVCVCVCVSVCACVCVCVAACCIALRCTKPIHTCTPPPHPHTHSPTTCSHVGLCALGVAGFLCACSHRHRVPISSCVYGRLSRRVLEVRHAPPPPPATARRHAPTPCPVLATRPRTWWWGRLVAA